MQDGKHIFEHVVQDLLAGGHISEDKFVDRALDSMRHVTAQLHANIAMLSKKDGDKNIATSSNNSASEEGAMALREPAALLPSSST
jgi:hypothetical protein